MKEFIIDELIKSYKKRDKLHQYIDKKEIISNLKHLKHLIEQSQKVEIRRTKWMLWSYCPCWNSIWDDTQKYCWECWGKISRLA